MQQTVRRFNIITLRPHWGQYIISQGFMFLVSLVLFLVAGHDAITFKMPFLVLGTVTMLMKQMRNGNVASKQQENRETGFRHYMHDHFPQVTIHEVNLSLDEKREKFDDILEQFFGLKTISIYSGDRTNPKLDICGVQEKVDVVGIIRERVEYNKQIKGVYEITNRY